eukprot:TRINITY_DN275_c0_g2_i1.p1 TRINITY_DN275_c0_g2~~TRINITY_DN275_c0_g2_i1.p1  ORF type:complete len:194 (+),score=40.94 TRINITY_DN275_c0_g2_i1:64-645(+)
MEASPSNPPPPSASTLDPDVKNLFDNCVRAVFSRWTVLCLAVEQGWGGRNSAQKADDLLQSVVEMFASGERVYADELEDVLFDSIENDFNTTAEDGSVEQVARQLTTIWHKASQGDLTMLHSTLAANPQKGSLASVHKHDPADDDSDEDDSSDDEDAPSPAPAQPDTMDVEPTPTVDPDGWETVPSRRGGKRR